MRVVRPTAIAGEVLASSTVAYPDAGWPLWVADQPYVGADKVTRGSRRFTAVQSGAGHDPALDAAKVWWTDAGAANRWAMFDEAVGSRTTAAAAVPTSSSNLLLENGSALLTENGNHIATSNGAVDGAHIEVMLAPGAIDTLALLDLQAETVTVEMSVGGTPIWTRTKSTNIGGTAKDNWFSWFFEPVGKVETLIFDDMPPYANSTVKVNIVGLGAEVSCGTLLVGRNLEIGSTTSGAGVGITDFSRDETDDFGVTTIVLRGFAKRMNTQVAVANSRVDAIQRELIKVRGRPLLWIGSDIYEATIIYGRFKSYDIDLQAGEISFCTLAIAGLV